MDQAANSPESPKPKWQPIPAVERRILGVLVEKAKTVPESYPMTLAGICTGANQKNNRFPVMQLEADQLEEPLERLRHLGAVALVQGSGRVEKFRHYVTDWLGVDRLELAVMTELLLRGAQTEGELRQRASRMEQIADLTSLRNVLDSLQKKNLILSLTPEGRGHVLTHNLYEPRELEKVRREFEAVRPAASAGDDDEVAPTLTASRGGSSAVDTGGGVSADLRTSLAELRRDVEELRAQLQALRDEVSTLR